ncbi:MAG: glycosyltransferase [Candidatus Aminicenantes bacterium]|nr:glycosyltransferase [Candidatus Aminicenantes bacterium]
MKKRKTQQRRVIIAGGGTGGHIYPGIAVAKKLLEKDPKLRIVFVGSRASLDRRILAREGIPIAPFM